MKSSKFQLAMVRGDSGEGVGRTSPTPERRIGERWKGIVKGKSLAQLGADESGASEPGVVEGDGPELPGHLFQGDRHHWSPRMLTITPKVSLMMSSVALVPSSVARSRSVGVGDPPARFGPGP